MVSFRYIAMQILKKFAVVLVILIITYIIAYPLYKQLLIAQAWHMAALRAQAIAQIRSLTAAQMNKLVLNYFCLIMKVYHYCTPRCGCYEPPWVNYITLLGYYLYSFLTFHFPPCSADYSNLGFVGTNTASIIAQAIPRTVLLIVSATIVALILSLIVGPYIANKRGSLSDNAITIFGIATYSFPTFYIGMIMIYIFAIILKIFPPGGMMSTPPPPTLWGKIVDVLYHLALPMITLAFLHFGGLALVIRALMLNVLREDYILMARAKGVPERLVVYKHALRAATPSIVVLAAINIAEAFGGAIITEIVFNWPGMGLLYWQAIQALDISMILALTYVTILIYAVALLIADILSIVLDPRQRRG